MPHIQSGAKRWSNGWLSCLLLGVGLLAGCSGGGDSAAASQSTLVGDRMAEGVYPQTNDTVFALVSDGNGGVYAGGQFTSVGQLSRSRLAHVLADGTVDPSWDPVADGPVNALVLESQLLYVGGSFFSLDGIERWRLAAVDRATGELASWNPKLGAANQVNTLASAGGVIYVGGVFELVNATVVPAMGLTGKARRNLAALDATTGVATPWNPNIVEGEVKALAVSGSVAYVGGSFDQVGLIGQEAVRLNLAAFDLMSGLATPWNPSVRGVTGDVAFGLHISDGGVYVGGRFDEIGGQPRENLAAVDRAGGLATPWLLSVNDTVLTFFDDGRRLYLGGQFTSVGGQARARLAAVDKTTGLLSPWMAEANGSVRAIAVSGGHVFVGGEFTTINGRPHNHLAVLDAETGQLVGE